LFRPDVDFPIKKIVRPVRARSAVNANKDFMASAKQLNQSGVLSQGDPSVGARRLQERIQPGRPSTARETADRSQAQRAKNGSRRAACLIGSNRVLAPDSGICQAPGGARG
jgi:hypothetical protein